MSNRYQAGIIRPGYDALKVPNPPTIGTATAGDTQASVAFTAPSCVGGGAITSYQAFTSCGARSAFGASSPLTVTGLTNGTSYTFKVIANNAYGPSYPSAASNSVAPIVQGQQVFTGNGTYSWVAPTGVTSVSVVAVGGQTSGNNCPGGGLGWKNNISVTPGNSYEVGVGQSYFISQCIVAGRVGSSGIGGTYTGDGGGNGGNRSCPGAGSNGGGGGAGGYTGNGGNGGAQPSNAGLTAGAGGGGGGGIATVNNMQFQGQGGGGVGLLGQGTSGAAGGCNGGSGGTKGRGGNESGSSTGGTYGGGVGGGGGSAAGGAVRIIWPGATRLFPSTNTGDV
jgi:hypothetical protein